MDASTTPGLEQSRFYIEIDYPSETEDPARIFHAMAALIDAFEYIDHDIARRSNWAWEPILVLEKIEVGSLRAILLTVLRHLEDESLKNLDWKPLAGQYLVRFKHYLIRSLTNEKNSSASDRLQRDLFELSRRELGEHAPLDPIPAVILLEYLQRLADAIERAGEQDALRYVSREEKTIIKTALRPQVSASLKQLEDSGRVTPTSTVTAAQPTPVAPSQPAAPRGRRSLAAWLTVGIVGVLILLALIKLAGILFYQVTPP